MRDARGERADQATGRGSIPQLVLTWATPTFITQDSPFSRYSVVPTVSPVLGYSRQNGESQEVAPFLTEVTFWGSWAGDSVFPNTPV